MHPYYSPNGITLDRLQTLLDSLATTYTCEHYHDGTWKVLATSGDIVYRGTQKECLHWLAQQPTA